MMGNDDTSVLCRGVALAAIMIVSAVERAGYGAGGTEPARAPRGGDCCCG